MRVYVMGMRGADREPAMAGDIAKMSAIVKEGIEAGALGFSTSRSILHRLKDGRLAPTITVNEDELTGIARGLKEANKGVLQFIDDFNDAMEEASASLAMWRRLARGIRPPGVVQPGAKSVLGNRPVAARARLHRGGQQGGPEDDGAGVQPADRRAVLACVLDASVRVLADIPRDGRISRTAQRIAEMRKPEVRAKLMAETPSDPNMRLVEWVRDFDHMYPLGDPPNYSPNAGRLDRRGGAPRRPALRSNMSTMC